MDDKTPKPRRSLSDGDITTRRGPLRPSLLPGPLGASAKPGAGPAQPAHNDHDA